MSWLSGLLPRIFASESLPGGQNVFQPLPQRPQGLESGSAGRRMSIWQPASEHINALLQQAGTTTVARARHLSRNNGYARAAIRSWAAATVGAGIVPSPILDNATTKKAVSTTFAAWTDRADIEGRTDFYGIQRRVTREVFLTGECFVQIMATDPATDPVPMRLQVLPSEQVPLWKSEMTSDGNPIRMGIEFDKLTGERVGYWFWRHDPSDTSFAWALQANQLVRVPAADVLHVFDPQEAGQIRGLSGFAAALVKMFMLDVYDDAELERKKQAARFAGFLTNPPVDLAHDPEGQFGMFDAELPPYFGPGAFLELNSGQDIKFSEPADVGGSYETFQYRTMLQLSAALGVPYAELSADLSKATYASSRAGLLAFRAEVEAFQYAVLVFQFVRPVYERWMRTAVLANRLPITATQLRNDPTLLAIKAMTPKAPWVDPMKDTQAEALAVQNGFKSRSDVIEGMGFDAVETDDRIAADRAREKEKGLTFTATSNLPLPPVAHMPAGDAAPADPSQPKQEAA